MIHRYHLDDWFIVIDTCSGSVHTVDEIAYEMIGCYEQKAREEAVRQEKLRLEKEKREEKKRLAALRYSRKSACC